jgi:RNA polymerase subunit RPABC4/transcription elongation factor Spt4
VSDDDDSYDSCLSCGKSVFPGVSECPYCHNDPYAEYDACSHCNRSIAPGAVRCPYCGNYTDDRGPVRSTDSFFRKPDGGFKTPFLIVMWLLVLTFLGEIAFQLYQSFK